MTRSRSFFIGSLVLASCALPACSESGIERRARPPEVEIITPETDGVVVRRGDEPVVLNGLVYDSSQPAPTLDVSWEIEFDGNSTHHDAVADDDGFVPLELDSSALSFGEHRATLHAVDHDEEHGFADVLFVIAAPFAAPQVTITAPADGSDFEAGEAITFSGEAVDSSTPPEALVFQWFADGTELSGAVSANGQSIVVSSQLAAGIRTVELRVTDTDGDVGADTVAVRIGDDITPAQPGDVVFSEMNVNPEVVDDEFGEWVELFNTAGHSVDITGYTFRDDDNDSYTLTGDLVVPSGAYFVLCANMELENNGGVPCDGWFLRDWQGNGVALGNGEDELVLTRADGVEIDWLHYDNSWYTPGHAIGVHPDHLDGGDNDDASHWCLQTSVIASGGEPGTPGRANDPC